MFQIVFYRFSWEKYELIPSFLHLLISKLNGFRWKPIFFLSELQEEVEIKLGEDVEYVLKDEGMQLKYEGVGQVIHEGLENLS